MHCEVSWPLRVFLKMALLAAVSLSSRMRSSGSSVCLADPCIAISGDPLLYLPPSKALLIAVRSLRAAATLTGALSHPNNAPGIAVVAIRCWAVVRPTGKRSILRQQSTAVSILLVTVVPRFLAVVSM